MLAHWSSPAWRSRFSRFPIQVSDSFGNMLKLSTPWPVFAIQEFTQPSYLRPFLWLQLKAVNDLSGGQYYAWFRGFHVMQVVVLAGLYLHLVRPRSWRDAAAVPLGLAVLVGHHAFTGTVTEAFPINTFLTVVVCCFAAAALALGKERWWNSLLAVAIFVYAALSVESGLLVFVVFAVAAMTGARGVPRPGLIALAVALAGYFALRFAVLDVGTPALSERASGFGFSVLEPAELARRFADRRLAFYAYNVVASGMSVVLGEPRGRGVPADRRPSAWRSLPGDRRHGRRDHGGVGSRGGVRLAPALRVAGACLHPRGSAGAALPGGAARECGDQLPVYEGRDHEPGRGIHGARRVRRGPGAADAAGRRRRGPHPGAAARRRALALAACALLSIAWSVRLLSLHVEMRVAQHKVREDWAYVDDWIALQRLDVGTPASRALKESLRTDALLVRDPAGELDWARRRIFY